MPTVIASPEMFVPNTTCEAAQEARALHDRYSLDEEHVCRAKAPDRDCNGAYLGSWYCTRAPGHEGPHIASGGRYVVRWPWKPRELTPEERDRGWASRPTA
jgi:hypothetical protein